jgi:hypothetical protein
VQGDINVDRITMLVFRLPKTHSTISDVLRPKPHCVFPASTCVEKKIKSQAAPAAERMRDMLQVVHRPELLFVFEPFARLFVREFVPTQVMLRGRSSGAARLYNPASASVVGHV